jgi:hypothetical protein
MIEVVVYFTDDYSLNESIWVSRELTKEEITKKINERFETWYFYDIL